MGVKRSDRTGSAAPSGVAGRDRPARLGPEELTGFDREATWGRSSFLSPAWRPTNRRTTAVGPRRAGTVAPP